MHGAAVTAVVVDAELYGIGFRCPQAEESGVIFDGETKVIPLVTGILHVGGVRTCGGGSLVGARGEGSESECGGHKCPGA